jgi:predicted ATP-grasp superfamily ATP-dependent carboligase
MINKHTKKVIENSPTPIAFVMGCNITGLSVIRSLGTKGIPIIGLDKDKNQLGLYSKYCNKNIAPDPFLEEKEYIDFLVEIGQLLNDKGVLIPSSDIESLAILKNKTKLEKYYHFIMSDLPVSEKLINKILFYKTLEKLEIKHPKTYYAKNEEEVMEISKEIKYPCIIKPAISCYFRLDFDAKVVVVNSKEELYYNWIKLKECNHETLIQEIIYGEAEKMHGLNAYYGKDFCSENVFMYQRIREWPHFFGNGSFLKKTYEPELKNIVSDLIKNIQYFGIIDAEFKKDEKDGSFKLLEINSRPWMQYSFSAAYGCDVGYFAYMDAVGKTIEKQSECTEDLRWVILSEDIRSSLKSIKNNKMSFNQWISSYKCKKIHAFFDIKDPIPLIFLSAKSIFNLSFFDLVRK